MSAFNTDSALTRIVQTILSRLNKISTDDGKMRSDGAGTFQVGVPRLHTHEGTGEGGLVLDGNAPLIFNVDHRVPTINDDSTLNYVRGSQWLNTITGALYICIRADSGAAVWKVFTSIDSTFSLALPRHPVNWALYRRQQWVYRPRPVLFYSV